ncbi:hypothetical protein [Marisediminicola sp. LYQ134]|uniref:DUF7426 family protein n=1 Tax=Marisediminicola sp. LYQ134 TaxID=3391061 RepID=UPI0039830A13
MGAVDFSEWAAPALELPFEGRIYRVQPPTVEGAKKVLAAAVRGEVKLGLVAGEVPPEVEAILATIKPGEHPALGRAYQQMADDGVPAVTIDRMAYYATFFWARGREYADRLAVILFAPRELPTDAEEGGDADPKV